MSKTVLSVAEKPSVAKELARIISGGESHYNRRNGCSPYNPIFEIETCKFKNENVKMKMTSVTGHLMEIEFDPAFKGWNQCQPIELFQAPIVKEVKSENSPIKRTLVEEATRCTVLLLWLDCDLEGENIAFEVMKVCLEANPRLDVYRARFSALVERDIFRTMQFPDRPNQNMSDAVDARQEIDLRIGAAFTRFQTMRLQKKYENIGSSVISYGPCQFPTLGFVVDRHLKIEAFSPEIFWYLTCEYEFDNPDKPGSKTMCTFNWERSRLYDRFACMIAFESCLEGNRLAKIIKCDSKSTTKQRPFPMNTIDLQKKASTLLRLSSDRTMAVAEGLYQRGILSYPRTETTFFQENFELNPLIVEQCQHSLWGAYASALINNQKFLWPRKGHQNDQAHPPIHPTKCVELKDLQNEDEKSIYELVTRHFLACCSYDATGYQTNVTMTMPAMDDNESLVEIEEIFHTMGLIVNERNWLDVYQRYDNWYGNKIPNWKVGETFQPTRLMMREGVTTAPEPISESDLISEMDCHGIGTDATIATHISTIQQREYVTKDNSNRFIPTKLGLALIEGYNRMGYQLNKPALRAAMEADCQKITKGELRKDDVIRNCLQNMKQCFESCNRDAIKLDQAMDKYFVPLGSGHQSHYKTMEAAFSRCGICRNPMDLRIEDHPSSHADDGDDDENGQNQQPIRSKKKKSSHKGNKENQLNQSSGSNRSGSGPASRFLYCPTCVKAYVLPTKGTFTSMDHQCFLCQFQVVSVLNPTTNKSHTICPHCFSSPPLPPIGIEGSSEFRCFHCAKEECSLSGRTLGSEVDITLCVVPRCEGVMRMKKNSKTNQWSIVCSVPTCKNIWYLPKFVKSVSTSMEGKLNEICGNCWQSHGTKVLLLSIGFFLNKVPPGTLPFDMICPSCDPIWESSDRRDSLSIVKTKKKENQYRKDTTQHHHQHGQDPFVPQMVTGMHCNITNTVSFATNKLFTKDVIEPPSSLEINDELTACCDCGETAKLLTVSKSGPNTGRQFFSCAKFGEAKCTFFKWADGTTSVTSIGQRPNDKKNPMCQCGLISKISKVTKDTPNHGKEFYTCNKQRDDTTRCGYFAWVDESSSSSSAPTSTTYASNYGGINLSTSTCNKCKQLGHWAKDCNMK